VTSVVPDRGETVSEPPPQIMIAFNHELDVTQIDARGAHIEALPSGAPQSAAEVIPARISISSANLKALLIWPSRALGVGRYRVVVATGSTLGFMDTAGHSLALGTPNELGESVISTFDVAAADAVLAQFEAPR
jgi:hypothetical protein